MKLKPEKEEKNTWAVKQPWNILNYRDTIFIEQSNIKPFQNVPTKKEGPVSLRSIVLSCHVVFHTPTYQKNQTTVLLSQPSVGDKLETLLVTAGWDCGSTNQTERGTRAVEMMGDIRWQCSYSGWWCLTTKATDLESVCC